MLCAQSDGFYDMYGAPSIELPGRLYRNDIKPPRVQLTFVVSEILPRDTCIGGLHTRTGEPGAGAGNAVRGLGQGAPTLSLP